MHIQFKENTRRGDEQDYSHKSILVHTESDQCARKSMV